MGHTDATSVFLKESGHYKSCDASRSCGSAGTAGGGADSVGANGGGTGSRAAAGGGAVAGNAAACAAARGSAEADICSDSEFGSTFGEIDKFANTPNAKLDKPQNIQT